MNNNTNMIIAIVLSLVVVLGWQYFVADPYLETRRQAKMKESESSTTSKKEPVSSASRSGPDRPPKLGLDTGDWPSRKTSASKSGMTKGAPASRVRIETGSLSGSISLEGGKLDELTLKKYKKTLEPGSDSVVLLSPWGSANPYFVETGWLPDRDNPIEVPDTETIWSQVGNNSLTPDNPVVLRWSNDQGFVFTRTISVDDKYVFRIIDEVDSVGGGEARLASYSVISRFGEPETSGYYLLHEGLIGLFGNSRLTEVDYSELQEEGMITKEPVKGSWLGFVDKYWAVVLIPDKEKLLRSAFTFYDDRYGLDRFQASSYGEPVLVNGNNKAVSSVRAFVGAKEVNTIRAYEHDLGIKKFGNITDWGWFWFITQPMFWLLDQMRQWLGNFGLAILAVTVILKLALFPVANRSYESMSRMKKLTPKLKEIQERYKDDKQKQQEATVELYNKEDVHPLAGCLPSLVQIPIFFSLYKVLFITIEMRHTPFFGWIHDLAAPDPTSLFNLFGLLPYQVTGAFNIGMWPILMGVTMFLQMRMNPPALDKTQKLFFDFMPLVFVFMLSSFPAGLVIYWTWNNALSIAQQAWIMKRNGVKIELFDNLVGLFKKSTGSRK